MASKDPEEPCITETDEETIALRKKRSRRVSFADREITSVHIFNRDDEDYESPTDSLKLSSDNAENEVLGFFKDLDDSDDSKELSPNIDDGDDDDEVMAFLRPIGSPSPGGSAVGSATSNDEDNFFGPVSASFIRPGRLSDSAASDENHDITMDSTAFSMHFRSLARSDSGDLKTPRGVHLAFEEKTPSQFTTPSDPGSFMVLTKAKKPVSKSPLSVDKVSGGRDSNDMSLVGENLHRYDYGTLSPTLEALLAEGSKDLHAASVSDFTDSKSLKGSEVSLSDKNGSGCMDQKDFGDKEMGNVGMYNMSAERVSVAHIKLGEANGISTTTLIDIITRDCLSNTIDGPATDASIDHPIQTPNKLTTENKEVSKAAIGMGTLNVGFPAVNSGTPPNMNSKVLQLDMFTQHESGHQRSNEHWQKENSPKDRRHNADKDQNSDKHDGSPLAGSISSLSAKRQQIFLDTTDSSRHPLYVTPSPKQLSSFISEGSTKNSRSMSYIQKSISKLKTIEPSPSASTIKDGIEKSKLRLALHLSSTTSPFNNVMEENSKDPHWKHADAPITSHLITAVASPYKFCWPEKQAMQCLLMSENSLEGPPVKSSELKRSLLTEFQGNLSGDLKQWNQYNEVVSIGSGRDGNSTENVTGGMHFTANASKLDSLFVDRRARSGSPLTEINHFDDFSQEKRVDDRESYLVDLQNVSETFRNFQTPSRDSDTLKFQSGSPDGNHQLTTNPTWSKDILPTEVIKASSPHIHNGSPNDASLRKSPSKKELTKSPAWKEPCDASLDDNMQPFVWKDVLSPKSNSNGQSNDDCHQGLHISHSPFPARDIEYSSRHKRGREEIVSGDADHADKISRIQRSSKVNKIGSFDLEFVEEHSNGSISVREKTGGDTTLKHWTDIPPKFSADTKQLLSPLIDKINIRAIGMLEDILIHLRKVHIYEALCSEIQSQKLFDESSNVRHKRVAETRSFLYKIVYEKAKLHLMSVKHKRLQKRVQQLSSGIQDSRTLKLNYVPHLSIPGERDAQVNDNLHSSCLVNFEGKHEVASNKLTALRHKFEALDGKIKNLTKYFHTYCKMKGEPSCADTIVLLDDHLKKRTCCRFLRQDLQLWEVDDLEGRNGHHNVVLDYHGFICQRITVNTTPVSGIFVSNKLNDKNIIKYFPNIGAPTAFAFVLNAKTTKKYVGFKSLAQETQMTSSLLRNLLDVVEELQLARLEIRNLTHIAFHSPSVECLDLQLSFIDFNSSRKVMMTLDMTCLNCGVYPSAILPYRLLVPTGGMQKSLPQSLSSEIKAAIDGLRVGYSRIIRLCRCVWHVVQSSSS